MIHLYPYEFGFYPGVFVLATFLAVSKNIVNLSATSSTRPEFENDSLETARDSPGSFFQTFFLFFHDRSFPDAGPVQSPHTTRSTSFLTILNHRILGNTGPVQSSRKTRSEVDHGSGLGAFSKRGGKPHYLNYPFPYPTSAPKSKAQNQV